MHWAQPRQHIKVAIANPQSYGFSFGVGATAIETQTVYSNNVFKHALGFAGIVTNSQLTPVKSVEVRIYGPDGKLLAIVYTDQECWHLYPYKYTG